MAVLFWVNILKRATRSSGAVLTLKPTPGRQSGPGPGLVPSEIARPRRTTQTVPTHAYLRILWFRELSSVYILS
jgi:hypothetical protein